jgi:hypothetical protein
MNEYITLYASDVRCTPELIPGLSQCKMSLAVQKQDMHLYVTGGRRGNSEAEDGTWRGGGRRDKIEGCMASVVT